MSLPKRLSYYPTTMLDAIDRAIATGEFLIPLPSLREARALNLQFQGLRGALVKEGKTEKSDMVGFYLQPDPPALIIRRKEQHPLSLHISAALGAAEPQKSAAEQAEEALARILGLGKSPSL